MLLLLAKGLPLCYNSNAGRHFCEQKSKPGRKTDTDHNSKSLKTDLEGSAYSYRERWYQLLTEYGKCPVMSVLIFNEEKWLKDSALFSNSGKLFPSWWGTWKRISLLFIFFLPYEVISLKANSRLCNWYGPFWSLCTPLVKWSNSMVENVLSPSDWSCCILERTSVKCDFVSEYNIAYFKWV